MDCRTEICDGLCLSPEEISLIRETLGNNIRRLRKRRSRTIEELSHMAGIHGTFLGHIELGRRLPSIHTLIRIARVLEVLPAALLAGVR
ncbi:MAG TPA: hypothetical protein DEB40_12870 [Elusimicrobia bacterium]|nr:hypothetical protein [Elusimicrobiota bacterium]HBT62627.1 hypothetical protein [Elusimicrobiota bacterium]